MVDICIYIMIRMTSHTTNIAAYIPNVVLYVIIGLGLKKWSACQQDWALANKGCLRLVCGNFRDVNTVRNYCRSHGFSNRVVRKMAFLSMQNHLEINGK